MKTENEHFAGGIMHWMVAAQMMDIPFPFPKELAPCHEAIRKSFLMNGNSIECENIALRELNRIQSESPDDEWGSIMENLNVCLTILAATARNKGWDPNKITVR